MASDSRKQQIIAATIEVIREKGLAAIRIQEIARRAETSTGLIVYHFETLDGVIAAALESSDEAYYARLESADSDLGTAVERLCAIVERSADPRSLHGSWTLWMELWVRALRDDSAARLRARLDQRWRDKLQEVIEQGIAEGAFRCPDPAGATVRLAALLDGLSVGAILEDHAMPAGSIASLWYDTAALELGCERRLFG